MQTLDDVFDLKNLPILYTSLIYQRVRHSIRLIRVFGNRGCKVIFITNGDKVFAFGLNRDGSLGLGTDDERIRKPVVNHMLSGKQIVDIAPGFEHCIGLTATGQCYAWGQNGFGQLGIGNTDNQNSPQLIEELHDLKVDQIYCGAYHSMALTNDGDLFAWGHNTFAQLGDRTYNSRYKPTAVMISEKVLSICCGTNHSVALTKCGKVYVWGNNSFGQLGRDPEKELSNRLKPMCNRPIHLVDMKDIVITKAICGANHNLLLSNDNNVYSFGLNNEGQVGNGTTDNRFKPQMLNKQIKIKDIVSHFDNELSIAVSTDDKCYVWGQVYGQKKNILKPVLVEDSFQTIDDIYVKMANNKVMFQTLVINSLEQIRDSGLDLNKLEELEFKDNYSQCSSINQLNKSIERIMKNLELNDDLENGLSGQKKTFDTILDIKLIPILGSKLNDENVWKSIKLLTVFGKNGSEVIYVTNEDLVYCYGPNESGCLGLGCDSRTGAPMLNGILSHKNISDICFGFKHCIALTAGGQCYSWGCNKYGQLGVGNNRYVTQPKLIVALVNKRVAQICCGAYHSLALTNDGKVYAWGQNKLGQLGDCTYKDQWSPIQIKTKHSIHSINSGWNHSTAVADIGIVYMWGHNQFGQLGHERETDYRSERKQWIANRPLLNHFFKNIQFKKAICGANHSLLLTTDGFIYAFGDNTCGQIGNGSTNIQSTPIRLNDEISFKDIIVHFANDISIGVTTGGQYYIWGLVDGEKVLTPQLVPDSSDESEFNIYAKYAINKITFKTIVVNENQINKPLVKYESEGTDNSYENSSIHYSDESEEEDINYYKGFKNLIAISGTATESTATESTATESSAIEVSTVWDISRLNRTSSSANILLNLIIRSFNDPNYSDLKIMSGNKAIYCHKTILKIRNQQFWNSMSLMSSKTNGDNTELEIFDQKFSPFYAFIQYLYGIEPEFNDRIIFELQSMAQNFGEPDLLDNCSKYIQNMETIPNSSNVCTLYEKAIMDGSTDLENSCLEFVSNNWKSVVKSDPFLTMNDKLSKRLIIAILSKR